MAGKSLWFIAEGTAHDGSPVDFWVYKKGRSIWISGPNKEHLCHPSVTSQEKVKSEILLVFQAKVKSIKLPSH